jgi:hypothetical protein
MTTGSDGEGTMLRAVPSGTLEIVLLMRTHVRLIGRLRAHQGAATARSGRCSWLTAAVSERHHEVRDAVHVFIHYGEAERMVIDSQPFQRLRDVHQLALSYLVYPGASHKRFEHSLGVMEVAGRIFDVVTRPDKVNDAVRDVLPEFEGGEHQYWRRVLRMAALCHDTGHLPFSHAAEDALLRRMGPRADHPRDHPFA